MSDQKRRQGGITSGLSNMAGTVVVVAVFLALLVTYSAMGATQHANPWTFFAYNDRVTTSGNEKHIDISGTGNTFNGGVKSNGDLDIGGSNNVFNTQPRYYDDLSTGGSGTVYNAGTPAQEAFSAWPGTLGAFVEPACSLPASTYGTRTTNTSLTLTNASPNGVYCRGNGDVNIGDSNVTRQFTILTSGKITIGGQNANLSPAANGDGVLFYSTSSNNDAINWSGSNGIGTGLAFAVNGGVMVGGSNSLFCNQWAGRTIQVNGSSHTFNQCLAVTPSPTLAPTQPPTEPPPTEPPPTEPPPTEPPPTEPPPTEPPPTEPPPTEPPPTEPPPTEPPPTEPPPTEPPPTDGPTPTPDALDQETLRPTPPGAPDTATSGPAAPASQDTGNVVVLLLVGALAAAALAFRPLTHPRPRDPRRGT